MLHVRGGLRMGHGPDQLGPVRIIVTFGISACLFVSVDGIPVANRLAGELVATLYFGRAPHPLLDPAIHAVSSQAARPASESHIGAPCRPIMRVGERCLGCGTCDACERRRSERLGTCGLETVFAASSACTAMRSDRGLKSR